MFEGPLHLRADITNLNRMEKSGAFEESAPLFLSPFHPHIAPIKSQKTFFKVLL